MRSPVPMICHLLALGMGLPVLAEDPRAGDASVALEVTNVQQIRQLAAQKPDASFLFHLEGDIWWANPAQGKMILKDDSGAEELEMTLDDAMPPAGSRIRLEGNGTITPTGAGYRLGARGPVVDNNGVHGMILKIGAVYLTAGRTPLRLEWFNGLDRFGLRAEYDGPGITRQNIPDSALFRQQTNAAGTIEWTNGLYYRCCEVPGEELVDFDKSPALKTGPTANFDLKLMARPEHIGLAFTGYLDVPRTGLYHFYLQSDDGSRLFAGGPTLRASVLGQTALPTAEKSNANPLVRFGESGAWVAVEGKVDFASQDADGLKLEIATESGRVRAELPNQTGLSPQALLNQRVDATGFRLNSFTSEGQSAPGVLLVPGAGQMVVQPGSLEITEAVETNTRGLPLLVTAAEIHRLKREEAQKGYPVRIRGVVTSTQPEHQAFTLQDGTRGIYIIDFTTSLAEPARIGEYLEVEGTTDPLYFAPVVRARAVRRLGAGRLPEPVHPTRDQLLNGSLDAQYVEMQGVVTSIQPDGVNLLTQDGPIKADLRVNGLTAADLGQFEDALVRIRGCFLATWDYVTHRVRAGEIRIYGAEVMVEQPAPADLFSTPSKSASELLLFDPQGSVFQRVKVSGQIIHVRGPEYFMMDRKNGVRFTLKRPAMLDLGDRVEVVGFPELSGPSPVLREAVVRKTGHGPLPPAKTFTATNMVNADADSTLVQVEALLVDQRTTAKEQSLEMRMGLRTFLAWLPEQDDDIRAIPPGSRLQLTGTYAVLGGSRGSQDVPTFEILLNSAGDIAVLARPPWWTLERLLYILGALACILAATVLWITQLRHKVEQRTVELETQIQHRQRVEQQHALEQERARIAQDLHDELGSGLTEITMLGARAQAGSAPPEKRNRHLDQMSETARQMVTVLDEIVWAMNPKHDSLASMVSYFSLYADKFLGLANIAWRFDGPLPSGEYAVDSRHRHQLFLAFKEALTNVVRHSGATEVRLSMQVENDRVRLSVTDNGKGLPNGAVTEQMDGVVNMRARLEKLGGRFEVQSQPGRGTVVRFDLPAS